MDRQQWLAERRTGIGGSDVAAILGLNPYQSAYSVWADKLGLLPEQEDNEAMKLGRDLEHYVAQRFYETSGKKVRRANKMLRDPTYPFMLANIDRDVVKEPAGLECKTTSMLNMSKFKGGEFPEQYYCQCCHYLSVTGYTRWYLAVLVLNAGFLIYQMTRLPGDSMPDWCHGSVYIEQPEVDALIRAEAGFWKLVEDRTPPPVDGSDATRRAILHTNPERADAETVDLSGMEPTVQQLGFWKAQKKEAEVNISLLNNQLIAAMGGAPFGEMQGYELRLQTIEKKPYTVTPKPYQQLRIKEVL